MSLSTITQNDMPPKRRQFQHPEANSLKTSDIEGARPCLKGYGFTNKPEFAYSTVDIAGSQPRELHPSRSKPHYSLQTSDIDRANPAKSYLQTGRIGHNPLEPFYKLASFETKPATPPKFIRDSININDIQGTKPEGYMKWSPRDIISVNDIEGARPKPYHKPNKPDLNDPRDINLKEKGHTCRQTNPLMPSYIVKDDEGNPLQIGEVDGSQPKKWVPSYPAHSRHLDTSDIEGAKPGTVGLGPFITAERKFDMPTKGTQDIEGAQAGTLKKGITSMRVTHPLDPLYKWATEDKQDVQVEAKETAVDPQLEESKKQFWGTFTPSDKRAENKETQNIDPNYNRNLGRFYCVTPQSPFENNVQRFYTGSGVNRNPLAFKILENPSSIHRPKPKVSHLDKESKQFVKDTKAFYADSRASSRYNFKLNRDDIRFPVSRSSKLVNSAKSLL